MEDFKDLPLWRQCYKIGFPGIYDENDTYDEAEFKKAYKLSSGIIDNDMIPNTSAKISIGNNKSALLDVFSTRILTPIGTSNYSYDNIINDDTKLNLITNFEFGYAISSSKYFARAPLKMIDSLGTYRSLTYGDYFTLIALKLDNLNRRVKALEG